MNSSLKLLEEIKIGSFRSKNRVMMAAHSYGYVDALGLPTEQFVDYLVERAKGGVGIVVMGGTSVSTRESALDGNPINVDDLIIPWYEKIALQVHQYGTLVLDQLMHAGAYLDPNEGSVVVAPSAIPQEITCSIPRELSIDEIEKLTEDFAQSAERCKRGGLDGVEIKCDQGLLIHQFLSPIHNQRHDQYGGTQANRLRFLIRILEKTRAVVGKDFIVGIRISGDSMSPGDLSLNDNLVIVKELSELGYIDYIHVNGATNATFSGYLANHGDSSVPLRNFSHLARAIKSEVSLPVIAASMILTPHDAEHIISTGIADMVAMTRAHIADPEIVNKLSEGRSEEIRPCVLSNQGCIGNHWKGKGVHCIHNVAAGREKELGIGTVKHVSSHKKILVVGGGVSGLEFSRVAAACGHQVELFEKGTKLGGQILLASQMPYRHGLIGIVQYLETQAAKEGVRIHRGIEVEASDILSIASEYDTIVLATGSQLYIPPTYVLGDSSSALTIAQMVEHEHQIGENVIVVEIDWRQNALSVAEWLLQKKRKVTLVSPLYSIGANLDVVTRTSYYSRLYKRSTFMPLSNLVSLENNLAKIRNVLTNEIEHLFPIDNVVFVTGAIPATSLYLQLKDKVQNLFRVGDCENALGIPEAILAGSRLARSL